MKNENAAGWLRADALRELAAQDETTSVDPASRADAGSGRSSTVLGPDFQAFDSSTSNLYVPQVRASLRRLRSLPRGGSEHHSVRVEDFSGRQLLEVQLDSLNSIELLQEDLAYLGYSARGNTSDGCYVFRHRAGVEPPVGLVQAMPASRPRRH